MWRRLLWLMVCLLLAGCVRTSSPPQPVAEAPADFAAWVPDGRSLLYGTRNGPVMQLNLDRPEQPVTVTTVPTFSLTTDGKSIAYVSGHQGPQRLESTIYVQSLAGGDPVDLFAGTTAIHGVSGVLRVDRWVDANTLAYYEAMGTAVRQLWLIDVPSRRVLLPESIDYAATTFTWTADGSRVAGQWSGGPANFWLWDRVNGTFIKPTSPLPGEQQHFEAWAPDNQSVLFTAWSGGFAYWDLTASATLYRWHLDDGRVEKVAENAGLAGWSGPYITYVQFGERPELVVTADGKQRWSEPLGKLPPQGDGPPPWPQRPLLQAEYIAFAHLDGQWYVSPLGARSPHPLAKGHELQVQWAPDARHLGVLGDDPVRLQVFVNPVRK